MKKLSYLLGLFIVAGLLFSACSKDEESLDPPSLSFLGGAAPSGMERVDSDVEMIVSTEFVFGIAASKVSDKDLRRILIVRKFENVSTLTVLDSTIDVASITFDITEIFSWPSVGSEDFEVTVWDKGDKSTTISFTITTTPAASNITVYDDKILGAQNSTNGSSFASSDGTIYSLADAKANSAEIDWMYFYGATNMATLAAPNDADAADVFNNAQNGLQTWDTKNATKFKLTELNTAAFNSITTSTQLVAAASLPQPDLSKINNLKAGDVLGFTTVDQMYGLILINSIDDESSNGSIDITVKIQ